MRVCFAGGMANNSYMVAKQMAKLGLDVRFMRDLQDFYPISQPVWEDVDFSIPYAQLTPKDPWTLPKWHDFERSVNWTRPPWLLEAKVRTSSRDLTYSLRESARDYCASYGPSLYLAGADVMETCDISFVSTNNAMISAMLSGRPYVVCPAGSEFMYACDQIGAPAGACALVKRDFHQISYLVRESFNRCTAVVTHVPFEGHADLCGGMERLEERFGHMRKKFWPVSMPYLAHERLDKSARISKFLEVMNEMSMNVAPRTNVAFVPSRIDYRWKGQNRLIEALALARSASNWLFVFSAWGEDYEKFKAMAGRLNNVVFLPGVLSKQRLVRMFECVDLVVDQFLLGHYGTAAREALSVGAPVMAYVHNHLVSGPGGENLAPVINVQRPADIAAALDRLAEDQGWARQLSDAGLAWTRVHSDPRLMQAALERALEKPQ